MRIENDPPTELPWWDDRNTILHTVRPEPWRHDPDKGKDKAAVYDTPKKIYDYLDARVWKQAEAKKAAAIILYDCLRGVKSNAMFIGPTASGKTEIWRQLKRIYPDRIEIADASCLTQEGWKGSTKWKDLIRSPMCRSENNCILVLDEADKMLTPKFASGGENVSQSIQAEGLTLLEGTTVEIQDGSIVHKVNTGKISFVLCGALSAKAGDIAEKSGGSHIGFGAKPDDVKPYDRPLNVEDMITFGAMPEFMGRIQRVVNLQPMTQDDFFRLSGTEAFRKSLQVKYGADIRLSTRRRRELAARAYASGLGVRDMENGIRQLLDEALFEDCGRESYEF